MIMFYRDKKEVEDIQNDLMVYRDFLLRYQEIYEFDKVDEVMKKVDVYWKCLNQFQEDYFKE